MKINRKWWVVAPMAAVLCVGLCAAPVLATTNTATSKTLAMAVISPVTVFGHGPTAAGRPWAALLSTYGLTDGYIVDNTFQSGQTTGWHSHPGPSLIFVVAGTITNYDSDAPHCAGKDYTAPATFIDAGGNDVHMLLNNGSQPAETIAVQLIPSGQPRRIDKDEPANCHV